MVFDAAYDHGVLGRDFGCDDHMKMVGENDNGIDAVTVFGFAHTETFPQQINVV